jgi:hypothetical protein
MALTKAVRPRGIAFAAAAAAVVVGLSGTPALAATWTVKPGGEFGLGGKTTITDTKTLFSITCKAARLDGAMKSGSGLGGADIGSLTAAGFTDCTSSTRTLSLTVLDLPWRFNVTSYKNGVVHGTISHIELSGSLSGCSFVIDGTRGGASDGILDFSYTNATGILKITGSNLHFWDIEGCLGLLSSGDPVTVSATLTMSPKQTITSP